MSGEKKDAEKLEARVLRIRRELVALQAVFIELEKLAEQLEAKAATLGGDDHLYLVAMIAGQLCSTGVPNVTSQAANSAAVAAWYIVNAAKRTVDSGRSGKISEN